MDGFNFLTCLTSYTFWSIAQLFLQPYQWPVWTGLGISLMASAIALVALKLFIRFKFSFIELLAYIFFNLIEVSRNPGYIVGRESALKLLLGSWLLMSIVLTGSYKGLLISYLTTIWTPEQEYKYFHQMTDFQFYSRVPEIGEKQYWETCAEEYVTARPGTPINIFCNKVLFFLTPLGRYSIQNCGYAENNTILEMFTTQLIGFPKNESNHVFQNVIGGGKLAIAGLNTEIDELMFELKAKFDKIKVFRGKDNLWSHTQYWLFTKVSYCQPRTELVQLQSSGIYQFWKYWIQDRKFNELTLKEEAKATPQPLSLNSNMSFTFVILITGLISAAKLCLIEIIYVEFRKYISRIFVSLRCNSLTNGITSRIRVIDLVLKQYEIQNVSVFAKFKTWRREMYHKPCIA